MLLKNLSSEHAAERGCCDSVLSSAGVELVGEGECGIWSKGLDLELPPQPPSCSRAGLWYSGSFSAIWLCVAALPAEA